MYRETNILPPAAKYSDQIKLNQQQLSNQQEQPLFYQFSKNDQLNNLQNENEALTNSTDTLYQQLKQTIAQVIFPNIMQQSSSKSNFNNTVFSNNAQFKLSQSRQVIINFYMNEQQIYLHEKPKFTQNEKLELMHYLNTRQSFYEDICIVSDFFLHNTNIHFNIINSNVNHPIQFLNAEITDDLCNGLSLKEEQLKFYIEFIVNQELSNLANQGISTGILYKFIVQQQQENTVTSVLQNSCLEYHINQINALNIKPLINTHKTKILKSDSEISQVLSDANKIVEISCLLVNQENASFFDDDSD